MNIYFRDTAHSRPQRRGSKYSEIFEQIKVLPVGHTMEVECETANKMSSLANSISKRFKEEKDTGKLEVHQAKYRIGGKHSPTVYITKHEEI